MATPTTARIAPIHSRDNSFFPEANSNKGTVTTAREQMNADSEAAVVSNPMAWATYPTEFHKPTSKPMSAAPAVCGESPRSSQGMVARDARPKRSVEEIPTGMLSPSNLTREKLVP